MVNRGYNLAIETRHPSLVPLLWPDVESRMFFYAGDGPRIGTSECMRGFSFSNRKLTFWNAPLSVWQQECHLTRVGHPKIARKYLSSQIPRQMTAKGIACSIDAMVNLTINNMECKAEVMFGKTMSLLVVLWPHEGVKRHKNSPWGWHWMVSNTRSRVRKWVSWLVDGRWRNKNSQKSVNQFWGAMHATGAFA